MWAILVVGILLVVVISVYFILKSTVDMTFVRHPDDDNAWAREDALLEAAEDKIIEGGAYREFEADILKGIKWIFEKKPKTVYIDAYDGIKLCAHLIENPAQKGIILMAHGFRSNPLYDFSIGGPWMYESGYSLLLIDQRGTNMSGGDAITFGVKERYDVREWAKWLDREYPGVPVALFGISLGASTVLMASGLDLPGNVKGIVADCGYTTPEAICKSVIRQRVSVLAGPIIKLADIMVKKKCGFSLKECDTREEVRKNRLPLLICHGLSDTFVPCDMSRENYEAAKENCDAEILLVVGADHALSCLVDEDSYKEKVFELLSKAGMGVNL